MPEASDTCLDLVNATHAKNNTYNICGNKICK